MVDCLLCERDGFKNDAGLRMHIIRTHKADWNEYKAKRKTAVMMDKKHNSPPPPPPSVDPQPLVLSPESIKEVASQVANIMQTEQTINPGLPPGVSPIEGLEEVEVIGEKINYKVALNPDVFWRWNVFKGQNMKLAAMGKAQPFNGGFADFLDLATKTLLSTYGMYPTVMTLSGGKMLVEMPLQEEA